MTQPTYIHSFRIFAFDLFSSQFFFCSIRCWCMFLCKSAMLSVWLYSFLGLTTFVASSTNNVFTNSFLVRFQRSIENDIAHEIAARNGFENVGEVIYFHKLLLLLLLYFPFSFSFSIIHFSQFYLIKMIN